MGSVNKAIVDVAGNVLNVIVLKEGQDWPVPSRGRLVDAGPDCESGGTFDGVAFTRAPARQREVKPDAQCSVEELALKRAADTTVAFREIARRFGLR